MNREQAREILLRHRPEPVDPHDPEMAEALAQLQHDPELARWFEQHTAWQSQLRATLRGLTPPAGLREQIIRGAPARHPAAVLGHWQTLAWAALIAVSLGGLLYWMQFRDPPNFEQYRSRMVRTALRDYRMDMVSQDQEQIRRFIRARGRHGDYQLPQPLQQLPGVGAAVLTWQNRPVSLVCLQSGPEILFLFIIDRAEVPAAPAQTEFRQVNKMATASWQQGGRVYLLAGLGDRQWLEQFVPTTR